VRPPNEAVDARAVNQLANLERRTTRGARDSVDHPRDQHDDLANGIAGLVYVVAQRPKPGEWWIGSGWGGKPRRIDDDGDGWGRNASPPCTLSAEELAKAGPSDETVARWQRHAAALEAAAAAERRRR